MRSNPAGNNPCTLCDRPSIPKCAMVPLCQAESGKKVKVACVNGERGLCARMAALGIYPGVEMQMLCCGCVRVNGGTLSLGKEISNKILVTLSA